MGICKYEHRFLKIQVRGQFGRTPQPYIGRRLISPPIDTHTNHACRLIKVHKRRWRHNQYAAQ